MYTWMLFVHVFMGWGVSDNAIFVRDAGRDPIWKDIVKWLARFRVGLLLLGLSFWIASILFVDNALFFFVPPLAVFALVLALTIGPIVVEERTKSNWELLLTVPYDMKVILLGKASGALWHIRSLTYVMGIFLMCISAGVGIISVILIPISLAHATGWYTGFGVCGVLIILPVLASLLFIVDRIQQYALMLVAALASGTATSSIRGALSTATTAVLLVWLFEIAVTETVLVLGQGGTWQPDAMSILLAATLGPLVSYISEMDLSHAALFAAGTLLLREVLISGLWRWTLRSARS